jgi:hypothetical protein
MSLKIRSLNPGMERRFLFSPNIPDRLLRIPAQAFFARLGKLLGCEDNHSPLPGVEFENT